ncbi:MAG TPA: DUF3563 family protein [Dongiaceae bacterium]
MALSGSWLSPGTIAPRPSGFRAAWRRISDYLELNDWQRRVRREEAYLAQSASLEDLERRMRDLDREEQRPRFIGYF